MARQTISYLTKRFREVGLQPDSRHGQNFLIDLNLIQLLADSADIGKKDVVLEVGTGTGSLTEFLVERAGRVITVEIDGHLYQLASEQLAGADNLVMLQQDALRNKNNLSDAVLQEIAKQRAEFPGGDFILAANLPYNVATPIIGNLLTLESPPARMCVTIQKELGERITAPVGSKDYSALSVWIQSQCDAHIVRIMSPKVFWPRPKVESAIVRIDLRPDLRAQIKDRSFFHTLVRDVFIHRRKFLRSGLLGALKGRIDKPTLDEVLAELGHGPTARAEALTPAQLLALADTIQPRLTEPQK